MPRYEDDAPDSYLDEERDTRRKSILDAMEGGPPASAAPEPAAPSTGAGGGGTGGGGALPPSAPPPPEVTGDYSTTVTLPQGPVNNPPPGGYPPFVDNLAAFTPTTINVPAGGGSATFGNAQGQTINQKDLYGPPAGAGAPGGGPSGLRDQVLSRIADFAKTHPGANNSILRDPEYWARRIMETHPDGNIDWGYWEGRMLQPEGPPESARAGGIGRGAPSAFNAPFSIGQGLPPELAQLFSSYNALLQQQMQQNQQLGQAKREAILRLMQQGSEPVDIANDKTLGPAAAAYKRERTQGAKREREALAERAAFTGLNLGGQGSGAFETGIQGINEGAEQDISGYTAKLAVNELQQRRQLLMQAAQIADAVGARDEAAAISQKLAEIDAMLKQQQFGLSYAQLGQQQGQFEDQLGFNYNQLLQGANRDALLYSLRG